MRAMVYRGPYKVRVEEKDMPAIEHPERRDRPGDAGGDLRLGPAPLPRDDARHPGRHDLRPRVHRRGRGGRLVGAEPQARRPGHGAVQHLLRLVLLLRPRAVLELPQRQPQRHRRRRHLRLLAHLRWLRRRPVRVRPGAVRRRRARASSRTGWTTRTPCCSPTPCATGYFGAQLGDIVEGDIVVVFGAGPVGLFAAKSAWLMGAGRVIVIDHLEYRLEKARSFAHAETYNFTEYDDIVVHMKKITDHLGRGRGHRRGGRRGRRQPHCSTSRPPSSSCRAARRWRSTGRSTPCARAAPSR